MNIAIVLMKFNPFGGYERQAAILAGALADRGDDVTVVANKWIGDSRAGIKFQKISMFKGASWLKVLSFAFFSRYYLNQEKKKYDVIIAFDRTLIMDIYRAGNACHKEWLNFRKQHGNILDLISIAINPLHVVINEIERFIFSRIKNANGKIIVLSDIGAHQISKYYPIEENHFSVIPPAVDLTRFDNSKLPAYRMEQRKILGIDNNTLVLLHVGSGFRIKGLKSTIAALSILRNKGLKAELVVAGKDGSGTKKHLKLCQKLGLVNYVHFLGGVKDIEHFYAAADIFIMPSLFETFGIAVIEALASGLPVIVGRGAGVSSVIEQEKVGKIIDVPACPEKLAELIEETALAEKESKASGRIKKIQEQRATVALKYNQNVLMNAFVKLIVRTAEEKKLSQNKQEPL